jgi:hypothetical protein
MAFPIVSISGFLAKVIIRPRPETELPPEQAFVQLQAQAPELLVKGSGYRPSNWGSG